MRRKFKLSHSIIGTTMMIAAELAILILVPAMAVPLLLIIAAGGAAANLYVATEVVEEVRQLRRMMALLCIVLCEFVIFFSFQYAFIAYLLPASYPALEHSVSSYVLQSLMVFVFNPLYTPADAMGRWLLIINTVASLGLVLFVLQNIWQLRREHMEA